MEGILDLFKRVPEVRPSPISYPFEMPDPQFFKVVGPTRYSTKAGVDPEGGMGMGKESVKRQNLQVREPK